MGATLDSAGAQSLPHRACEVREINSTAAISDSAGAQSLPHRACEVREIISSAEDEARHLYNLRALYPQPKKTIADHEGTVVTIDDVFGKQGIRVRPQRRNAQLFSVFALGEEEQLL